MCAVPFNPISVSKHSREPPFSFSLQSCKAFRSRRQSSNILEVYAWPKSIFELKPRKTLTQAPLLRRFRFSCDWLLRDSLFSVSGCGAILLVFYIGSGIIQETSGLTRLAEKLRPCYNLCSVFCYWALVSRVLFTKV